MNDLEKNQKGLEAEDFSKDLMKEKDTVSDMLRKIQGEPKEVQDGPSEAVRFPVKMQENLADDYANELVHQLNGMSSECRDIIVNKLKLYFW